MIATKNTAFYTLYLSDSNNKYEEYIHFSLISLSLYSFVFFSKSLQIYIIVLNQRFSLTETILFL